MNVDEAARAYDASELRYLLALRAGSDELAEIARATREAADVWQGLAYASFFRIREDRGGSDRTVIEMEIQAEKAEMLKELWTDIASAHAGSCRPENNRSV